MSRALRTAGNVAKGSFTALAVGLALIVLTLWDLLLWAAGAR